MKLRIEIKDHIPPINSLFDEASSNYKVPLVPGEPLPLPPPLVLELELDDHHLAMQQADAFLRACLGQRLEFEEKMDELKAEVKQVNKQLVDQVSMRTEDSTSLRRLRLRLDKFVAFVKAHDFPKDSADTLAELLGS